MNIKSRANFLPAFCNDVYSAQIEKIIVLKIELLIIFIVQYKLSTLTIYSIKLSDHRWSHTYKRVAEVFFKNNEYSGLPRFSLIQALKATL